MPTEKKPKFKKGESIAEIGQGVPSNFKFGLIVAITLFWVDFVRSILNSLLSLINFRMSVLTDFILAIAVTILGYIVLKNYSRIKSRLKKIKM